MGCILQQLCFRIQDTDCDTPSHIEVEGAYPKFGLPDSSNVIILPGAPQD